MDQVQREPTFEESVKQVMQTLPPPVRSYLAQGKYTLVAKNLMTKYALRIDQAGVLEREIMLLLMGIDNPDEFTQTLVDEAKLDQQTVTGIVQDVNAQIFVPLRAEMMSTGGGSASGGKGLGVGAAPAATRPAGVPAPGYSPPVSTLPKGSFAPPPQSPSYLYPEDKLPFTRPALGSLNTGRPVPVPPKPVPQRPAGAIPAGQSARPSLREALTSVGASVPSLPKGKALDAGHMLEDHEEPHIEFHKATPPPPANLPGAIVHPPLTPKPAFVPPSASPRPSPGATQSAAPPPRNPSIDPYREPIE